MFLFQADEMSFSHFCNEIISFPFLQNSSENFMERKQRSAVQKKKALHASYVISLFPNDKDSDIINEKPLKIPFAIILQIIKQFCNSFKQISLTFQQLFLLILPSRPFQPSSFQSN